LPDIADLLHKFFNYLFLAFSMAIFARVIMSWFAPNPSNPLSMFIIQITEPILGPIRQGISKIIPNMGSFDLSPMVAIVLLNFVIARIVNAIFKLLS
jgi:YggT family protein